MQDKIIFHDVANDGHRFLYNHTVMSNLTKQNSSSIYYYSPLDDKLQETELEQASINFIDINRNLGKNRYSNLFFRLKDLVEFNRFCSEKSIDRIHFFNLDSVIVYLFILFPIFFNKRITGTLHWFPSGRLKQIALQLLLKTKLIKGIIVHGPYTYSRFDNLSEEDRKKTIQVINYPNLHIKTRETKDNLFNHHSKPVLLAFGGLRFDKGVDTLLHALHKIKHKEFTLVIAGKEEDFTKGDLETMIERYGLGEKVILHLGYVRDDEIEAYFSSSDIIVLPYRKIFTGQSGPLTEGVMNNKIVLGPSHGEIGFTISRYGLGDVFESEDVTSLANKLSSMIDNHEIIKLKKYENQETYKSLISKKNFVEKYQVFFF